MSSGGRAALTRDFEQLPGKPRLQVLRRDRRASSRPSCSSATRAAALGFVQVRRGHHNREAARRGTRTAASRTRGATPGSTPVVGSSRSRILRLVHERAGERQLLLHAAREPIGPARSERRELRHLEQPIAARLCNAAHAVNLGEERDVLVDATDRRRARTAARDSRRRRSSRGARAIGSRPSTRTVPPSARQQSAGHADRGRLSRAIGADQAEHLARLDRKRHARRRRVRSPYRFVTRSKAMAASIDVSLLRQLRLDRHPRLQHAVAIVGAHLDAIHELRALGGGLHVARRELRLRRDERDACRAAAAPASVTSVTGWPRRSRGTTGSST